MLTRRHIRIKVMQAVYSFSHKENSKLKEELDAYDESTAQPYELYTSLLSLLGALMNHCQEQLTTYEGLSKKDEKYKSLKSISQNKALLLIQNHPILEKKSTKKNSIKWELEFSFLNDLLDEFISDKAFKKYQALPEQSWEEDVKWIIHCYRNHIATSDFLYDFLEDQSINWIDDLPLVNTYFLKTLGKLKTDEDYALPFPQFNKQNEDLLFGRELLEKVIINQEALEQELEGKTPNWEADRIAYLDRIILKIAIAELLYFPSIPAKVTLNEYLELAKDYSTPKSNHFVNGVLDKLVREFEQENRLNKTGRGLL